MAALFGEIGICPVFKVCAHIGLILSLQNIAHRRLYLDILAGEAQIEFAALHQEVKVGVPKFLWVIAPE